MKINNPIYAMKYINRDGVIKLHYIRKAVAITYMPGGQRDTRIFASKNDKYYRWYVSYGGDYRPQVRGDEYAVIGDCIVTPDNWSDLAD